MTRALRAGGAVLAIVILALLPLILTRQNQQILVTVGIFALLALGLNVVVGQAGLLDLGYVAFFAIGAYSAAYLMGAAEVEPPGVLRELISLGGALEGGAQVWTVFPVAMLITMAAGVLLGTPVLRLRGDYLAIVTLGFGEIVRIFANNADAITRGARGLNEIPVALGVEPRNYYYLLFGIILIVFFFLRRIEDSRIGRAWIAIREDEAAAEAMGVNTLSMKLLAFAIGAGTASFAGVVQATRTGSVAPTSYTIFVSILILAQVVLGGMGSRIGVIVGTAIIVGLPETEQFREFRDYRFVAFGALLVLMMIYRPQGIVPSKRRAREMMRASSEEAAPGIPTEMEVEE